MTSAFHDYTEIIPGLWMGGQLLPGYPPEFDAVVDCRLMEDLLMTVQHKRLLWIPFGDIPKLPPLDLIDMGVSFVEIARKAGLKTLAHCTQGHNRSGLIIGSYLIRSLRMNCSEVITLIKSKRPGALTNKVFVDYLGEVL